MDKKMQSKKLSLIIIILLVLGLSIVPDTLALFTDYAEVTDKGISISENSPQKLTSPEFVSGQLVVKLKDGKTLEDIEDLNAKYKVVSVERIFKDSLSPQDALKQLKDKLSRLTPEHQTWYWQLDKESVEYKEYIAKIKKERESLQKQILAQEDLITHIEERQKRAAQGITLPNQGITLPNLENIYILETSQEQETDIPSMAADYQANPAVEYAEPNYIIKIPILPQAAPNFPDTPPNDTYVDPDQDGTWTTGAWGQPYEDLWGLKKIQTDKAWPISQGEGVIVAVVDTGIDYNHEDIVDNVWVNNREIPNNGIDDDNNGYIDDVKGWDFVGVNVYNPNPDNDSMDGYGHGTHVAGIIAAIGNNGKGIIGVAPKAKVMAIKGFDDMGSGSNSGLASAIRYAADNGVDVINCSWGGFGKSLLIEDAINNAYSKGCVIVAAAGNSNSDVLYYYPANLENVITVAASDENDIKVNFSNYGTKIDVAAPGGGISDSYNILSLLAPNSYFSKQYVNYIVGSKYIRLAGTSMAASYVSGLIASILSKKTFNNGEIRQIIRSSANDIDTPGFDIVSGFGRINVFNSLQIDSACISQITSVKNNDMIKAGSITIQGAAFGTGFLNYKLSYATSLSGPWKLISNSANPIKNGILGRWKVANTAVYYLKLIVRDKNNREFQDLIGPIYIDKYLHDGWPKYLGTRVYNHSCVFAAADVNCDGKSEVIVGTVDGKVYIFKDNGDILQGWPIEVGSRIISDISLADIDKDGDLEIFFGSYNQYIYGYHHDGAPIIGWPQFISESDYGFYGIILSDIDNCGELEIVILPALPHTVPYGFNFKAYIFKKDGSLFKKWLLYDSWTRKLWDASGGSIGDINQDRKLELIVPLLDTTDSNFYIYIFDYNGNILERLKLNGVTADIRRGPGWMGISYCEHSIRPVLGDLDKDGDLDISIVGSYKNHRNYYVGKLFVWSYDNGNYTNTVSKDINGGQGSQLALGDVDNNGKLDILCAMSELDPDGYVHIFGKVKAFNFDGSLLWQSEETPFASHLEASPIIGDINGDGKKEIILVDVLANSINITLNLYIYNYDGSISSIYKIPMAVSSFNYCPPIIADLDNNGRVELAALNPDAGLIAVWDFSGKYNSYINDWPMFQHDLQRTGQQTNITPPIPPTVIDEGLYTKNKTKLIASWVSNDQQSSIAEYQYRITQDSTTGTVIKDWTSTGTNNSVTVTGLNLTEGKAYYFGVKAKNVADLWSEIGYSDGITLDTTPPTTTDSGIDGAWHSSPVTVTLTATDALSGVDKTYYCIDNSTPSILYTGPFTISNDGIYTVKYYSTDKATNSESVKTAANQVKIDTAPHISTIKINNDDAYTTTPLVTLNLFASRMGPGAQMQFSNNGKKYTNPEAYNTTKAWKLTPSEGKKTVWAKFKDASGRWSGPISDDIVFTTKIKIIHTPIKQANAFQDLNISADIQYPKNLKTLYLKYGFKTSKRRWIWKIKTLNFQQTISPDIDRYETTIPGPEVTPANIKYSIYGYDNKGRRASTETYIVTVN